LIVTKQGVPTQKAVGLVKDCDYVALTVTLVTDPEIFMFANGDTVDVIISGLAAAITPGTCPPRPIRRGEPGNPCQNDSYVPPM
jgi:hypothetical protein